MISERKVNKVTKEKMIRMVAQKAKRDIASTREVYNALEKVLLKTIMEADEENDVTVKLFEGITLECKYVPSTRKINNLTGKNHLVPAKLKPKFNFTRSYLEKINITK